jgi:hypothetical protein
MADPSQATHQPLRSALIHWLSGLIFSLIISALFTLVPPDAPILGGVVHWIEERGIDAAMWVKLLLGNPEADRSPRPNLPAGYVFVDVEAETCKAMIDSPLCSSRSPARREVVAGLATEILNKTKPRAIIIDSPLWDTDPSPTLKPAHPKSEKSKPDFTIALVEAVKKHRDVVVVAAAPFRPSDEPRSGYVEWSLVPDLQGGAIWLAPAESWNNAGQLDSIMRVYPAAIKERREDAPVLTLPYLAAVLISASRPPEDLDCFVTHPPPPVSPTKPSLAARNCDQASLRRPDGTGATLTREDLERDIAKPQPRILFTLPGRATTTPMAREERSPMARLFQNVYSRYASTEAFSSSGALRLPADNLADRVVIIGTSAPTALDWHQSPIGNMTGAEIILNATKAYLEGGTRDEPNPREKLLRELAAACIASLPFLLGWLVYFLLRSALKHRTVEDIFDWTIAPLLFFLMIAGAGLLVTFSALSGLGRAAQGGQIVDILTPIAALSLEGFAEGTRRILDVIERGARFLVGRVWKDEGE